MDITRARELLKGRRSNAKIDEAMAHENRLRLHGDIALTSKEAKRFIDPMLKWVAEVLPSDKAERFRAMLSFPLPTVELVQRMKRHFARVWDGRNPVEWYDFEEPEQEVDYQVYRAEIRLRDRLRVEGLERMTCAINSLLVVDLPAEQTTPLPAPDFYFVDTGSVRLLEVNHRGEVEHLGFVRTVDGRKQLVVVDAVEYSVFELAEDNEEEIKAEVMRSGHDLGRTPAAYFWGTSLDVRRPWLKAAPWSERLGDLDRLLFWATSGEALNLYARYPITVTVSTECNYSTPEGITCNAGYLTNADGQPVLDTLGRKRCPVCAANRLDGPGSNIEVDTPTDKDTPYIRASEAVHQQEAPVSTLTYNQDDIDRRKMEIFKGVTGWAGEPINNQAVNAKQVISMFESVETALEEPQANFEKALRWLDETICRLRYGSGFKAAHISLGTEHYLATASELLEVYNQAREAGADLLTLETLYTKYLETEYRNDAAEFNRQMIMAQLDPFRHRTLEEVLAMVASGVIADTTAVLVKANLVTYIQRFEREHGPIHRYSTQTDFALRVGQMQAIMRAYAEELRVVQGASV